MTVSSEPPEPENVKVSRTSPTTVQVTWDEPNNNNVIEMYRIYYTNFETEDMSMWQLTDTDGPTSVYQLTGLNAHQSYAVRLKSKSVLQRWSNLTDTKTANVHNSQGIGYYSLHSSMYYCLLS